MEVKNLQHSKDKTKIAFVLSNASAAYANALRRSVVSLVPTLAIEDVEFFENSSALYDEVIAHRLALISLTTDLETYMLPSLFPKDGVSRAACEVKLTLEAKGPCTVYADELKSKDPKVKSAFPKVPIVKLLKNQTLKFEATAVLGQGTEHMKWSAGGAYYQYLPVVKESGKAVEINPKDFLDEKSTEIFVKEDGSLSVPVSKGKNIQVTQSTKDFLFTIESWGQHKPVTILKEALAQLDKQIDSIQVAVQAADK